MCTTVIRYVSFVVIHSCAPNSDVCTGLQYTHNNVVSENDRGMSGAIPLQSYLLCNSINHTRDDSDSRAAIWYAVCPYTTCSFQVMHVSGENGEILPSFTLCNWIIFATLYVVFTPYSPSVYECVCVCHFDKIVSHFATGFLQVCSSWFASPLVHCCGSLLQNSLPFYGYICLFIVRFTWNWKLVRALKWPRKTTDKASSWNFILHAKYYESPAIYQVVGRQTISSAFQRSIV